jgi:hypothetical protein
LAQGNPVVIARSRGPGSGTGLLGKIAFVQLRRILLREPQPAAVCIPLAEPIEAVQLPAAVDGKPS